MAVKKVVPGQHIAREKLQRAKELRRELTAAERALWNELRTGNLGGFHFRRQQVIDGFIVNFHCHECALVVEVDGDIHDVQQDYNEQRQMHFVGRGFSAIRFSNVEVLNHLDVVKNKILEVCLSLRHPLPEAGRGAGG